MKTYVILFRGINVGGKNLLPMKQLTPLLEGEGYSGVQSYIQSGNVVLSCEAKPSQSIASLVLSNFGFKPEVLALEKTEFNKVVNANPFQSFEGKTVHLYFCAQKPNLNMPKLESVIASTEEYELKGKVFYLHAPDGIGRSKLVKSIEACLDVPATGRNLNTVSKLYAMLNEV